MSQDRAAYGPGTSGTLEPEGEAVPLRAGPLELVLQDGRIHTLAAGGVEVWRGVMFLYRDPVWGTPAHSVSNLSVISADESFRVEFDARCETSPAIAWHALIEGEADGTIRMEVEARPEGDLPTSRTGLCVLHPLSAAGAALEVEHADGRVSRSTFPRFVSPWPPFTQIRALRHEVAPGCWASCVMTGDTFEMEDQRNFSDASFKTYSGSNFMPRPYRLAGGESFRQSVVLIVENVPRVTRPPRVPEVSVQVTGERAGRLPAIGLALEPRSIAAGIRPDYFHIAVDRTGVARTVEHDWATLRVTLDAAGAGARLDLLLSDDANAAYECNELAQSLSSAGVIPESIAIFPTTARSLAAARAAFPRSRSGGGTPLFFTHLNRLSLPRGMDFISFSTCPIVHVADDRAVMQTLATLPWLVATLRERHPDVPFRVGPSGIGMRINPFGPSPATNGTRRIAMARSDARDRGEFGVAWALGYVSRMAAAGAEAVTLSSDTAFAGLAALAQRGGAVLVGANATDPERLAVLGLGTSQGVELWLANLTGGTLRAMVETPDGRNVAHSLDACGVVKLPPCALSA